MNKNISKLLLPSVVMLTLAACGTTEKTSDQSDWVSLFNGKNLDGWTPKFNGSVVGENYNNTFRVEDGLLTVSYDQWDEFKDYKMGHLFTNESYSNYRVRVEYRFLGEQVTDDPKLAWAYRNNGVMLHTPPAQDMELDQAFPISAEAQLLGGNGTDVRTTGNFCSPSTNIVQNGELKTEHCIKSNSKTFHGDQWVWFEAEVHADGRIKHFINDELVFEYSELQIDPQDEYGAKWLAAGKPLKITQGHFAIQAETHPTQFRVIEIKSLD